MQQLDQEGRMTFAQSTLARARPLWDKLRGRTTTLPDLQELTKVRSTTCISDKYHQISAGAVGTIVHVYENGAAFEVEFDLPQRAILVAKRDQIQAE